MLFLNWIYIYFDFITFRLIVMKNIESVNILTCLKSKLNSLILILCSLFFAFKLISNHSIFFSKVKFLYHHDPMHILFNDLSLNNSSTISITSQKGKYKFVSQKLNYYISALETQKSLYVQLKCTYSYFFSVIGWKVSRLFLECTLFLLFYLFFRPFKIFYSASPNPLFCFFSKLEPNLNTNNNK